MLTADMFTQFIEDYKANLLIMVGVGIILISIIGIIKLIIIVLKGAEGNTVGQMQLSAYERLDEGYKQEFEEAMNENDFEKAHEIVDNLPEDNENKKTYNNLLDMYEK